MAYKDPPKDKSMNAPACSVIALLMLAVAGAVVAVGVSVTGWVA